MKLIIDIPEREYKVICENNYVAVCACPNLLSNAIKNGTPIPDNATNGEMIKALFPNTEIDDYDYGKDPVIDVYGIDDTEYITLRKVWWKAPYQKGGKE